MSPFDFYRVYKPINLHFSQAKFDMMTKRCHCKESELNNRHDLPILSLLAGLYDRKEAGKTCIANFSTKDYWLTDNHNDIKRRTTIWKAYRKFPKDAFSHESKILRTVLGDKSLKSTFTSKLGYTPAIYQMWHKEIISSDFLVTLDKALQFIDECDEFWFCESGAKLRLAKSRCFVKLDTDSIVSVVNSIFKEF